MYTLINYYNDLLIIHFNLNENIIFSIKTYKMIVILHVLFKKKAGIK